jgi:ATP-binding protein involved in chromosome partitioning
MPRMLGLAGKKPANDGERVLPLEAHGLKVMSIGFMIKEDDPIIWRGPMVMGALEQMLRDVAWGELDVMVIDMPPGTGDTQLTISQRVPLAGAVIVSTPQDIALLDARRGLNMFRKVEVPILGLIENMSYYVCPKCGHREDIFDHGGAHRTADEFDATFLGEIPLDIKIRATSDGGMPIVVSEPESAHAKAYAAIASRIWDKLTAGQRKAPKISLGNIFKKA